VDLNEELADLPPWRPLPLTVRCWRWALTLFGLLGAALSATALGCVAGEVQRPFCQVWLEAPKGLNVGLARLFDFVFGADIIVGFPTETEAMFSNSLDLVDACGLTFLHVFPYSPRAGTPAARMPPVAGPVIKERAARLREKGALALATHLERAISRVEPLLVERGKKGRLDDFTLVRFEGDAEIGALAKVRITGHDGSALTGVLLD
jgi:hypothetical protein